MNEHNLIEKGRRLFLFKSIYGGRNAHGNFFSVYALRLISPIVIAKELNWLEMFVWVQNSHGDDRMYSPVIIYF